MTVPKMDLGKVGSVVKKLILNNVVFHVGYVGGRL
jgi:hypothetical protein